MKVHQPRQCNDKENSGSLTNPEVTGAERLVQSGGMKARDATTY